MRIAVFGTGGVGGYFGGRLALAGEDVVFIARGAHLDAMRANGLRVESFVGDFVLESVYVTDEPRQIGFVDVILVAVKAWQVQDAARMMAPMMGADTFIVPLCNGVDAPQQIGQAVGEEHVLGCICRISSHIVAPAHIRHDGVDPYVAFGELDGRKSARAESLLQIFLNSGINAEIPDNIQVTMWQKFIFITAISGLGAVARVPVGVLREIPETRQLLADVMQETRKVAQAKGVDLPPDVVEKTVGFVDRLQPTVIASMQRDIQAGRPSELESQNGAVVRMGKETNIPTPLNEFIYYSLLPQELLARGRLTR